MLSIYSVGTRARALEACMDVVYAEWAVGRAVVFHCRNVCHRAPVTLAVLHAALFGIVPLEYLAALLKSTLAPVLPLVSVGCFQGAPFASRAKFLRPRRNLVVKIRCGNSIDCSP